MTGLFGMTDALTGLFDVVSLGLVFSGISKLARRPDGLVALLMRFRIPRPFVLARLVAIAEVLIGATALSSGSVFAMVPIALAYLGFAIVISVILLARVDVASCGCFGENDARPSLFHVAGNLMAVAIVAMAAGFGHQSVTWGLGRPGALLLWLAVLLGIYASFQLMALMPRLVDVGAPVASQTTAVRNAITHNERGR